MNILLLFFVILGIGLVTLFLVLGRKKSTKTTPTPPAQPSNNEKICINFQKLKDLCSTLPPSPDAKSVCSIFEQMQQTLCSTTPVSKTDIQDICKALERMKSACANPQTPEEREICVLIGEIQQLLCS